MKKYSQLKGQVRKPGLSMSHLTNPTLLYPISAKRRSRRSYGVRRSMDYKAESPGDLVQVDALIQSWFFFGKLSQLSESELHGLSFHS
jgi:hypothetical protein